MVVHLQTGEETGLGPDSRWGSGAGGDGRALFASRLRCLFGLQGKRSRKLNTEPSRELRAEDKNFSVISMK